MSGTKDSTSADPVNAGTLAERLARIGSRIERIGHDTQVAQGGGQSYSATSINAIADLTRPLIAAEGVAIVPTATVIECHDEVTSKRGAVGYHIIVRVKWIITAAGESLEAESIGESLDYSDKGTGKAQTFARKNLLVALFNLSTGENPDAESPDAGHRAPRTAPAPRPQAEPATPAWMTRQTKLEQRAADGGVALDTLEVAVREACGDTFGYPRGLADDDAWAKALDALKELVA